MRSTVIGTTVFVFALALAACSGPRTEAPVTSAAGLPVEFYRAALERGERVYRIEPNESLVTVYVYRDGPLAGMGHDHVVASRDVDGFAVWADAAAAARADLRMPLATLSVDEAGLRDAAGFQSDPSVEDIAGTRANMLSSIEAVAFPDVTARVSLVAGEPEPRVSVELRLHGETRSFDVPVALRVGDDALEVSGTFGIEQTQFGISPHSVFGGALSVADRLNVTFRLRASRVTAIAAQTDAILTSPK